MKKMWIAACFLAVSCLEAHAALDNLIASDKAECLEELGRSTNSQLWNVFLDGQAQLFFDSEYTWIAQQSWWKEGKNVLGIGSRNGAYLDKLARQFQDKAFKGIEKSIDLVQQANARYSGNNLIFEEGNAEIFDDRLKGSADIAVFHFTLQHLQDPISALKNAVAYLEPNGYVLIIDSCDMTKKTSHPIPVMDEALQSVADLQIKAGKGNRKASFELLQSLETNTSPLNEFYEVVSSNIDQDGNLVSDNVWFVKNHNRIPYFNHSLLFLTLLNRTYGVPVDLSRAYDELEDYLHDENAWTSPGMHFLVLKKRTAI